GRPAAARPGAPQGVTSRRGPGAGARPNRRTPDTGSSRRRSGPGPPAPRPPPPGRRPGSGGRGLGALEDDAAREGAQTLRGAREYVDVVGAGAGALAVEAAVPGDD